MSFTERYVNDPRGRNFVTGGFITALFAAINLILAFQNPDLTSFGWLYRTELEPTDVNWALVGITLLLLWLSYLFLVIALGNRRELNGGIPSWGELFVSGALVLAFGLFVSNLTIAGSTANDFDSFSNFSQRMRWIIFLLNFLGILVISAYFVYSDDPDTK